eukprot:gene13866-22755_t
MSAPAKGAVEEANRQLSAMFQQLSTQEHTFKEILLEKEAEIVRLHQAMRDMEERQLQALEDHTAAAKKKVVELTAQLDKKDLIIHSARANLAAIAGAVGTAVVAIGGSTSAINTGVDEDDDY